MNHILEDSRSPTQQPQAPRLTWEKQVKAFQCREFAVVVVYWLCEDHWDGRLHIEVMNSRVTWYDADLGQPGQQLLDEIVRDLLMGYYSDDKIIFE